MMMTVEEGSVSCMYCQVLLIPESEQVQQNLWKREVDVEGVVTGVRDQGNCGSFWSLSSSGAIEVVNAIVTGAGSGAGGRQIKGIGRGFDDGGARGAGGRGRGSQGGKPGGSRGAG
ncbi:hypothetical protein P8452_73580 [Trifolium repens]|nr:hypothetical protein P8452_73580 [Trifolium repens]